MTSRPYLRELSDRLVAVLPESRRPKPSAFTSMDAYVPAVQKYDRRDWEDELLVVAEELGIELPGLLVRLDIAETALRQIADAGAGIPGWRAMADIAREALAALEAE